MHIGEMLLLPATLVVAGNLSVGLAMPQTADLAPSQDTIDRITHNEVRLIQQFRANLEIYAQKFDIDGAVVGDLYWMGEARTEQGRLRTSELVTHAARARRQAKSEIVPEGFADQIFPDLGGFDLDYFEWKYRGRELFGSLSTLVFDLQPKPSAGNGSFVGRIWVSGPPEFQIVRFDGTFTSLAQKKSAQYLHFIGVRNRVTLGDAGLWIPAAVYIDERDLVKPEAGVAEVKVRVNIWGMNKAADTDTSSGTLGVDGSEMATPLSELRTPKAFYERTEQNILSWMQAVGLLAPPSAVDKMVEGIIYKLLRNAPAESSGQVHARLLLTLPVEWFVVGNTLVISKSIVDTPADEAALAAVLAPAAASVLQSRPIQPISEAILQSRNLTLKKLDFRRSEKEIVQAEKEAMRLLQLSAYFPALANAAVFQRTAERYCAQLSALFLPRFGNGLSVCDPHSLLRQLDPYGPRKPEALPALPLHARLFVNGWTDEVQMLDPPQEDAPFQVLPIEFFPRVLGKVAQDRPAAPFPLPSAGVRVPATPPIR